MTYHKTWTLLFRVIGKSKLQLEWSSLWHCIQIIEWGVLKFHYVGILQLHNRQLTRELDDVTKSTVSSTGLNLDGNTILIIWFKTSNVGWLLFKEILSHKNCITVSEVMIETIWLSDKLVSYLEWSEESSCLIVCGGNPPYHSHGCAETEDRCEYGSSRHCIRTTGMWQLLMNSDG